MIWFLYILLDSIFNWWLIEKKRKSPHYLYLFFMRGTAAICYSAYVLQIQYDFFMDLNWWIDITFPFPFLFNTLLNTWRKKAIDHMGAESGWIDAFVVKHKIQRLWYWITLILFLIAWKRLFVEFSLL